MFELNWKLSKKEGAPNVFIGNTSKRFDAPFISVRIS